MYKAVVARIFTRELPGSDRIQLGTCLGYQVIVGKDVQDGTLGIFFEQGGQLSGEFATTNDLLRRKDEEGNPAGGYFEPNRRVKAIKMRGARSDGFFAVLPMFDYTGYDMSQLKEGDQFDELNGHAICNKYFTPATRRSMRSGRSNNRAETPMFARHIETEAFLRGVNQIPQGAVIYITEKVHGTSFRYGNVLEPYKPLYWKNRFINWLNNLIGGDPINHEDWVHLNGSRNVILERRGDDETGFYGKEAFRYMATSKITLHKGEVIYGEIVGYTDTGAPIMSPQDTSILKDKKAEKMFGKQIVYKYGCIPHTWDVYIYRITQVNEDGNVTELSWPQVLGRCKELGLKPVPFIDKGFIYDGRAEWLLSYVDAIVNGADGQQVRESTVDSTHPMEGVVVRYESEHGTGWLKHKSFVFGYLEGYLKEKDDYVDTEETA